VPHPGGVKGHPKQATRSKKGLKERSAAFRW
jgi:hypothetical protein